MRSSSVATKTVLARRECTLRAYKRGMSDTPAIIASGLPGNREEAQRAGITIAARMTSSDSNDLRRWTIVLILGFLFVAAFTQLNAVYGHKFFDVTGRAQWIWPRVEKSSEIPVAFFATRD